MPPFIFAPLSVSSVVLRPIRVCSLHISTYFHSSLDEIRFWIPHQKRWENCVRTPRVSSFIFDTFFFFVMKEKKKNTYKGIDWGVSWFSWEGKMMIDRCRTSRREFWIALNANLPTRKHRHTVVIMSCLFLVPLLFEKRNGRKLHQMSSRHKVTHVVFTGAETIWFRGYLFIFFFFVCCLFPSFLPKLGGAAFENIEDLCNNPNVQSDRKTQIHVHTHDDVSSIFPI